MMVDPATGALQIAVDSTDQADPDNLKAILLAKGYYLDNTNPAQTIGTVWPTTDLYTGKPYFRTDYGEQFYYDATLSKWLGDIRILSFGAGGNLTQGSLLSTFGVGAAGNSNGYPVAGKSYIFQCDWSYSDTPTTAILDIYVADGTPTLLGTVDTSGTSKGSLSLSLSTTAADGITMQSRSGNNVIKDSAIVLYSRRIEDP